MSKLKIVTVCVLFAIGVPHIMEAQNKNASPHILVYKTKKDYTKYVAVELSADKKSVTSYPAPTDMAAAGKLKSVKLHKGYLLSRSGVSVNTAYLNITTEAYGKLKEVPTQEALLKMVKDKSPVTELCDCGKRNEMTEQQINDLIDKDKLQTKCRKIK